MYSKRLGWYGDAVHGLSPMIVGLSLDTKGLCFWLSRMSSHLANLSLVYCHDYEFEMENNYQPS